MICFYSFKENQRFGKQIAASSFLISSSKGHYPPCRNWSLELGSQTHVCPPCVLLLCVFHFFWIVLPHARRATIQDTPQGFQCPVKQGVQLAELIKNCFLHKHGSCPVSFMGSFHSAIYDACRQWWTASMLVSQPAHLCWWVASCCQAQFYNRQQEHILDYFLLARCQFSQNL